MRLFISAIIGWFGYIVLFAILLSILLEVTTINSILAHYNHAYLYSPVHTSTIIISLFI